MPQYFKEYYNSDIQFQLFSKDTGMALGKNLKH